MSGLSVRNLNVAYGSREVLRDVGFEAHSGEVVGLLGPNGAGKTTLLRAICRLVRPQSGKIFWRDRAVDLMSGYERATSMAYLPQGQVIDWPLSVQRVVELGRLPRLGPLNRLGPRDRAAVETAMAAADVTDFADRVATSLSGGERARVLLARALAVEAPVLLADEPTASLDPNHALGIMNLLRRVAASGRLVMAVTHQLSLAARFCDRILLLSEGRVVGDGAPADVLTPGQLKTIYQLDPDYLASAGCPLTL